jgi:MFS family permease
MVERDKPEDKQENISASGLSPFKSAIFRTLWIVALFSYVGAAMYDVGASWLMTSLAPNPLFVSLVTTATTLPIFLFALPSGILSDIFDRRSILLALAARCSQGFSLIARSVHRFVARREGPVCLSNQD